MKRFRMGIVAAGKFYVGILVFVVLCCGSLTLMSCPQAPMMGVTGHSRFGFYDYFGYYICELHFVRLSSFPRLMLLSQTQRVFSPLVQHQPTSWCL